MLSLHFRKIVILGAHGFLGRELTAHLRRPGVDLLCLDQPQLDVTERSSLARAAAAIVRFAPEGGAVCVNAVGLTDATTATPERFYVVNGTAVGRIFDMGREVGLSALIQLSSEAVFGAGEQAYDEDAERHPHRPFGISKLLAELLLAERFGGEMAVLVLRLPVVVGVGQAVANPVSIFCHEAVSTGMIELFNGGAHRRKFVAISDVGGQMRAILARPLAPTLRHYNLGGHVASMREVAEAVHRQVPEACIVDREDDRHVDSLISTSRRIERDFGYTPRETLDTMIAGLLRPAASAAAANGRVRHAWQ